MKRCGSLTAPPQAGCPLRTEESALLEQFNAARVECLQTFVALNNVK